MCIFTQYCVIGFHLHFKLQFSVCRRKGFNIVLKALTFPIELSRNIQQMSDKTQC